MKVLVIGGGIVGLTIVRELKLAGVNDIVLLEKGALGKEASYAAAGMLAPQAESDADDAFFRLCCASRDFYPQFAEDLKAESGIDIELDRSGTLFVAFGGRKDSELKARFEWQSAAELEVEKLTLSETQKLEPLISPDAIGALYFPNDWQVENRLLLEALISSIDPESIEVRLNAEVETLVFNPCPAVTTKNGDTTEGDIIILATGAWTSLIESGLSTVQLPDIKPVKGQMISYRASKRFISRVIYSDCGYIVPRKDGRILAGATVEDAGFDKQAVPAVTRDLMAAAAKLVPLVADLDVDESWAGLRPRATDGLPLIGRLDGAGELYISTAHFRNGILLAPLTAKLLVDSILARGGSKVLTPFGPKRTMAAGL